MARARYIAFGSDWDDLMMIASQAGLAGSFYYLNYKSPGADEAKER